MPGMPSAKGVEWKGKDARKNYAENYDNIFKKEKEEVADEQPLPDKGN